MGAVCFLFWRLGGALGYKQTSAGNWVNNISLGSVTPRACPSLALKKEDDATLGLSRKCGTYSSASQCEGGGTQARMGSLLHWDAGFSFIHRKLALF